MSPRKARDPPETERERLRSLQGYVLRRTGARARSNSRRPPRMLYVLRNTLCNKPVFPASV